MMRRRHVKTAVVLLTIGFLAVELSPRLACAQGPAPREVFVREARLDVLKERIEAKIDPTYSAWRDLQSRAEGLLDRQPHAPEHWYVPGYYRDAEGHVRAKQGLQEDANAVYQLALCWRMTGEKRYARSAARLIDGWVNTLQSTSQKDDSTLSFSYHFPAMVFGADLLASSPRFPAARQDAFRRFCREKALPLNTMDRGNNWGNWGLVLVLACARYLDDGELLDRGEERWKELLDHQVDKRGHLHHEVRRSGGKRGIWYSHFSLFPQTIAAEILRVAGRDLYSWRSPDGRALRQAFEPLAAWTHDPSSFPYWEGDVDELRGVRYFSYFEILHAHWPNQKAAALLREARPTTARHSAPVLTFTHGECP
ncbi:MAG: alginate lyase family protein [Pirellulaceae bacterium]